MSNNYFLICEVQMIDCLVMDVDGTLTDGAIYITESGEEMKAFNIKDGYGIHDILIPKGIQPIIITGRTSKIVKIRCEELGITDYHQGVKNKLDLLKTLTSDLSKVAYIGDDDNDLACMTEVKSAGGKVGCPADASTKVKSISDFISKCEGGKGAVREFIEWLVI